MDIEIKKITLTLKNESSFEDLILQIQPYLSDKILCVRNGTELIIFKDRENFPIYIKYSGTQGDIYEFRDLQDNSYSVFGLDAATVFFPQLGEKVYRTASITHGSKTSTIVSTEDSRAELHETIVDI